MARMPRRFNRRGRRFSRVTIDFIRRRGATLARAGTADALIHAHGYRITAGLTNALAKARGRFRVAVADSETRAFTARMMPLVQAGLVDLYVAGRRIG